MLKIGPPLDFSMSDIDRFLSDMWRIQRRRHLSTLQQQARPNMSRLPEIYVCDTSQSVPSTLTVSHGGG